MRWCFAACCMALSENASTGWCPPLGPSPTTRNSSRPRVLTCGRCVWWRLRAPQVGIRADVAAVPVQAARQLAADAGRIANKRDESLSAALGTVVGTWWHRMAEAFCHRTALTPSCTMQSTATNEDARLWQLAPQALACVFASPVWKGARYMFDKQGTASAATMWKPAVLWWLQQLTSRVCHLNHQRL